MFLALPVFLMSELIRLPKKIEVKLNFKKLTILVAIFMVAQQLNLYL